MAEREPSLLGTEPIEGGDTSKVETPATRPTRANTEARESAARIAAAIDDEIERAPTVVEERSAARPLTKIEPGPRPSRREAASVFVVGFWKRLAAAMIDLAIVIPAALLITLVVSKIGGVHLPPSNMGLLDVDMWIDLVLATDPALVMGLVLMLAIGMTYLLVFQIVLGRTIGMRLLKMKIIDVYGDRPSPGRCVARCAGYLASIATLFLGFLWMGFDSEKRGLQDWIAGTYVIRA
ncbi:MAG: RDD family protein [Kofleriaceae bacterium]